ncbi:3-oxoacyl-[acyl-carrier-protein] synthase 3 [Alphaproteobacteria bacterium]|nr:3-oxoacyl-[acyl-carrier-protein] synthase 3 [Alphaproteobacteria bacterium]
MRAVIVGTGSYLPERVVSNDELAKTVATSDEWMRERTGIRSRHIAGEGQPLADLQEIACKRALESAGVKASDIDLIVSATLSQDMIFPSSAMGIQARIGATRAFGFDVSAACSGFLYALGVADSLIHAGKAKRALVVGAEVLSRCVDWTDRDTCVLFGDGAGAVVLAASDDDSRGIMDIDMYSDGTKTELLRMTGGVLTGDIGRIVMNGREVYKFAVAHMARASADLLARRGLTVEDVKWCVPHQANLRIIESVATRLHLPMERVIATVADHANTSAASIPLALDTAVRDGRVRAGDLVLLCAMGAGFTWGAGLVRI